MEPADLTAVQSRPLSDVADMAVAVQANVVQLKVAVTRRCGCDDGDIRTPSPGVVRNCRAALISATALSGYDDVMLGLRLREVWGQFCLFCWVFDGADPHEPPVFRELSPRHPIRCPMSLATKVAQIEKTLWRMHFEQRRRTDPGIRHDPRFDAMSRAAREIRATALGSSLDTCTDDDLLLATCETAGMLAAGRWTIDARWGWGQAGIMDVPAI